MRARDRHKIPITILICDADADARRVTKHALEDARVANELRFVSDGTELLDYLYQRGAYAGETGAAPRPGLILLAVEPPTADARDAMQHIHGDPTLRDIPIVALTASRKPGGARDVSSERTSIAKPVTLARLIDAVSSLRRYWLEIVELPPTPAPSTIDTAWS